MVQYSQDVLRQLRQAMVIFTIGKADKTIGWGSGFACFPDRRAIFTCAHNFTGALPEYVIARHASSDVRCGVPNVVFSKDLDCAIAILERPLVAEPLQWADTLDEGDAIAIPDYVQGTPEDRFSVAWKGVLADIWLEGRSTNTITKSALWVGSPDRTRDTRVFDVPGIHPGLSGSPMINVAGAVVGQAVQTLDRVSFSTIESHLLEEMRADAAKMYSEAKAKGYV